MLSRFRRALFGGILFASACGGVPLASEPRPVSPTTTPTVTPWPIDGFPALLSEMEALVEQDLSSLPPNRRSAALFRLAALSELHARGANCNELSACLPTAIALYKRIIREFPHAPELVGAYYYLGHALSDSLRLAEAQQVWRSLVCRNRYPYPVAVVPEQPHRDVVSRLPQDHDKKFWTRWEMRYPVPEMLRAPGADPSETKYVDIFPTDCQPISQIAGVTRDQDASSYLAEVWWHIGDYHFNEMDSASGPFNFNRAISAYKHALQFKVPHVHIVAKYKLAWTYFRQQRYETSVRAFVDLLRFSDEQEKLAGEPVDDFRAEAYNYISDSLTCLDFTGPTADEPYIPREDVMDVETDPRVIEQKMHVAIDRVKDSNLIPQNEKWTVNIYRALAQQYRELKQFRNTIELGELTLKKWPMHRDAPVVQHEIADSYDKIASQSPNEYKENAYRAIAARAKLSAYVGDSPWVRANKNDSEAIRTAQRLVGGGKP